MSCCHCEAILCTRSDLGEIDGESGESVDNIGESFRRRNEGTVHASTMRGRLLLRFRKRCITRVASVQASCRRNLCRRDLQAPEELVNFRTVSRDEPRIDSFKIRLVVGQTIDIFHAVHGGFMDADPLC